MVYTFLPQQHIPSHISMPALPTQTLIKVPYTSSCTTPYTVNPCQNNYDPCYNYFDQCYNNYNPCHNPCDGFGFFC